MKKPALLVLIGLAFLLLLPPVTMGGAPDTRLNVAIIWHQHQPLYKDPVAGIYRLPWVRMHAIKDYYDMVSILESYPDIHLTFNLVPSLLYQLDDYAYHGAKDTYMIVAQKDAAQLTREDKEFLLSRFFDANWDNIIKKHPRYWELLQKRGTTADGGDLDRAIGSFSEQDFRDLQVWFDLAWFDPDFQEKDPELKALIAKGRGFSEDDKKIIHEKQLEIIRRVVTIHKEYQEKGQIEITTTPFYHPILPLLLDTDLAHVASPALTLPYTQLSYPDDVRAQLEKGLQSYIEHFGRAPKGVWPSEQSVGEDLVPYVADAGLQWMVSSEGVLARSLGVQLRDESGRVARPELLYQPYVVEKDGKKVQILFRDIVLSDKIGFSYSGMSGTAAAHDLVGYLHEVKNYFGDEAGEKVVVIALDGENAWEYYKNDGKEFFHTLYRLLSEAEDLRTVTVAEYLAEHPATAEIDVLHTGSWISDNLETWIGESEENKAWTYLAEARKALGEFTLANKDNAAVADSLKKAWEEMYAAEGSDWFWWYGDDQNSGNDSAFDALFRTHLMNIYRLIGRDVPEHLMVPIIAQQPAAPLKPMTGMVTATVDGKSGRGEWTSGALFLAQEPGIPGGEKVMKSLRVGVDADALYLRVDLSDRDSRPVLAFYFDSNPIRSNALTRFSARGESATYLGFGPGYEVLADLSQAEDGVVKAVISAADGQSGWVPVKELKGVVGQIFELAIPFEDLGLPPGQALNLAAVAAVGGVDKAKLPAAGPAYLRVPEPVTGKIVFEVKDPKGDDKGPGSYIYPTNPVFSPGSFDLTSFRVLTNEQEAIFEVGLKGDIINVWNSPIGLSTQTIDIYIDTDHKVGSGKVETLGGRRVEMEPESAWEYAIWVEGWNQKIFTADGREKSGLRVATDTVNRTVTIRVPKEALGEPQPNWGYQVFILGQEGFPVADSLRVREVLEQPAEWRFGGGSDGTFDPNVIDMLTPEGVSQSILAEWDEAKGELARVPVIYAE